MLNYAETVHISTIVPPSEEATSPHLSTLLAHPDVQDGLRAGVQTFQERMFEEYHEKAWTEQDIIRFINHELSAKVYQRQQKIEQALGGPFLSYLHHLGFALGYLDQALRNKEA